MLAEQVLEVSTHPGEAFHRNGDVLKERRLTGFSGARDFGVEPVAQVPDRSAGGRVAGEFRLVDEIEGVDDGVATLLRLTTRLVVGAVVLNEQSRVVTTR
mgnify:CR=1 FL=1